MSIDILDYELKYKNNEHVMELLRAYQLSEDFLACAYEEEEAESIDDEIEHVVNMFKNSLNALENMVLLLDEQFNAGNDMLWSEYDEAKNVIAKVKGEINHE